jgi:hypothetical protein
MAKVIDSTNLGYLIGKMKAAFLPQGATETVGVDATPTASSTNLVESGGVYSFVGDPVESVTVPSTYNGTIIFTHRSGDTTTVDLTHTHSQYALKELVETSQPLDGMAPNTLYNLGILSGAVTFAFAAPTDNTIVNEYMLTFDSGTPAAVPTWPNSITSWVGNCISGGVPLISAGKHYEVSVIGAYGSITEY